MVDTAAKIKKVAVLGAGVMGGGIAAQMADAGVEVILLDLVPDGATNRNLLAETAVEAERESSPPGFVYPAGPARSLAATWKMIWASSMIATDHRGRERGRSHQAGRLSQDRRKP